MVGMSDAWGLGRSYGLRLALAVAFVALAAHGPFCFGEGLSETQKQQLQVHMTILNKLQAYSLDQQFKVVYGLVAKANERDRDRHRKYVENLMAKAEEVRSKGQGQGQEYLTMAQGYKVIADINQKIVKAYADSDQQKMDAAIAELKATSLQVEKVTGKPVVRDWFTPDETEVYAMRELARQRQAAKNPPKVAK